MPLYYHLMPVVALVLFSFLQIIRDLSSLEIRLMAQPGQAGKQFIIVVTLHPLIMLHYQALTLLALSPLGYIPLPASRLGRLA